MGPEAEPIDQLVDPGAVAVAREVEDAGVEFEVLTDRELAVEGEGLRHVADALARGQVVGVHGIAEEPGLALGGGEEAGQHLHRGGLAATVGAEEAEDLAAADGEADAVHGGEGAEPLGEVGGLDGGLPPGVHARRDLQGAATARLGARQQRDERVLQVRGAGAFHELGGSAGGDDAAGVHGDGPVEALGLVHVGGGDQHAHAGPFGADAIDEGPELLAGERIDAGGRLVEDEQVRVVDQGAAEAHLLLHAAGELAGGAVGERPQARGVEQGADAAGTLSVGHAEEPGEEVDVLEDAELEVEVLAQALGHEGNARAGGVAVGGLGHVAAEDADRARLDLLRAGNQAHERGLADAVGADQADHTSGGDVEVQRVERAGGPVSVRDAADRYHRRRVTVRRGGDAHAGGGHRVALRQGRGAGVSGRVAGAPWPSATLPLSGFPAAAGGAGAGPGKGRSSRSGQAAESSSRT